MNLISKNVCIDKLDDIVHKCKNTYYSTIKAKPADVMIRILNLKLVIMSEYQNTKSFLKKVTPKLVWRSFYKFVHDENIIMDKCNRRTWWWGICLNFIRKTIEKTNQKEFRTKKVITKKKKGDKSHGKWKDYDSSFNSLTDKR